MRPETNVEQDERTVSVQNAGYRWAYLVLAYALLLDVALRSFFKKDTPWDLMLLVIASGGVTAAYQALHRAVPQRWAARAALAVVGGAVIAAGVVLVHR
jgi:hypothetical protein